MGALAGVADAISPELTLILSLFIPFVGIVVPAVVILAVSTPSRTRRPATAASLTSPAAAPAAHPAPGFRANRALAETDLSWTCQHLRESEIFEGLTDRELRLVAGLGGRRHVAAGERLAHAGSRGDHLFLILNGEFRLLSHGTEEIPVRMAHPGEVVPLAVIIDPPVLVTTLEAITDGEVFALPRMRLLELFDLQPTIGLQVYRAASKSFESRYRKSLDGLVGALHVAMHPNEERLTPRREAGVSKRQPQQ